MAGINLLNFEYFSKNMIIQLKRYKKSDKLNEMLSFRYFRRFLSAASIQLSFSETTRPILIKFSGIVYSGVV